MPTNRSPMRSISVVSGCRAPRGRRSHGRVTSTRSSTSTRGGPLGLQLGERGRRTRPGCGCGPALTRLPASDLAAGGSAPISRRASDTGARSPRCRCLSAAERVEVGAPRRTPSRPSATASSSAVWVEQRDLLGVVRIVAVAHGLPHAGQPSGSLRTATAAGPPPAGVGECALGSQTRSPLSPRPAGWLNIDLGMWLGTASSPGVRCARAEAYRQTAAAAARLRLSARP